MATNVTTLKESRNLLDEITVKIDNIEKGYSKANTAQLKGLQDYKKILDATLDGEKTINSAIKSRSNLIKDLSEGDLTLAEIAEKRAEIQKRLGHHRLKEGSDLHTSHINNLKLSNDIVV